MINTKYVKCDSIIEKVKKDLPPAVEINIDDIVEYVWEALAKIGAPMTYITLYSVVEVSNYRAKLPEWLHKVNQVRFLSTTIVDINDETALANLNKSGYLMSTIIDTFDLSSNTNNVGDPLGYRYILKNNYIHTTFEEGLIEVSYDAMPMDTDGLPLIPDDIYFIEAVKWYIMKGYLWRLMMRDMEYKSIFQYADEQWNFYVNSASTNAKIPDRDGLQALMDKFLRIMPNLHRNIKYTYYKLPQLTTSQLDTLIYN
jgi:hypothetical protein